MADTTNRLAGVTYLSVDGTPYDIVGAASYCVSTVSRETVKGSNGVHGYKEEPNTPFIEISIRDSNGLTLADFEKMTSVTVVLQLANGKTITGDNLWVVNPQEVSTDEATFKIRFEGRYIQEV